MQIIFVRFTLAVQYLKVTFLQNIIQNVSKNAC